MTQGVCCAAWPFKQIRIGCDSRASSVLGDAWHSGKRICMDFAIIAKRAGVGVAAWVLNSEGQGPGWALRFQEIFAH